nr:hypothetical protein [Tanacetum cinerariifolium]
MSTQQDIYAVGFENRPPMLNKENYVPWSSRLLRYAKSRPNGKLIRNSIINGPYVRRMIPEPANDQAIQTILLGLPKDIYAAVDSCKTAQEIWLRVQQMMKGSDIGIQEKNAKLFIEWERFTSTDGESIESYYHRFLKLMKDLKRNKHFLEKIASNLKFLNNLQPEWSQHVTIVHQTKDLHTAYYTQFASPRSTIIQSELLATTNSKSRRHHRSHNCDEHGNLNGCNDVQNVKNQVIRNAVQNPRIQNVGNQNGIIGAPGNANKNPNRNGNLVAARAKGNVTGHNADLDEIEEVNANCILMANLQQASTSGTQTDKALYTELLEPIHEPHQEPQNDNNVISSVSSVEQSGRTVEQHPANVEETRVLYDSLYNNLEIEVEKVNTINRNLRETNAELTTELARYKNRETYFEISQEK